MIQQEFRPPPIKTEETLSFSHTKVIPSLALSTNTSSGSARQIRHLKDFRLHRTNMKKKQAIKKMLQNEDYISAGSAMFCDNNVEGELNSSNVLSSPRVNCFNNNCNVTPRSVSPFSDYGDVDEELTTELKECLVLRSTEDVYALCREAEKNWLIKKSTRSSRIPINWEELFHECHEIERMSKEDFDVSDDNRKNIRNKAKQILTESG